MEGLSSILIEMMRKIEADTPRNETDYEKNGLLYCGVCHTPKQAIIDIPSGKKLISGKFPVRCACIINARKESERRIRAQQIETLRAECFDDVKMRGFTFDADDGKNADIGKVCRNYADHFKKETGKKGLLLRGDVGTGKTFFACCIANALIDRGIACRCTSFIDQAKLEKKEDLTRFGLVVLDDFGAERSSSFMEEVVYSTIDTLYRRQIPFIITTNMTDRELSNASDPSTRRVLSRIYEACVPYEVSGKDRRRETLKQDTPYYKNILGQ